MKEYKIIMTLNGNLVLKEASKVKETEDIEIEIYAETEADAKAQFKAHKADLKKEGLI